MKTRSLPWWRPLTRYASQTLKGHPVACLGVGLTLVLATVTVAVRAQQSATTTDQLTVALAFYEEGAFRDAQPLFAATAPTSTVYGTALAYDALCRYEICRADGANGYRWFFDALSSPALQQAELPPALREDLTFKQIDARYQSRPFGMAEILPLAAAFRQDYAGSPRLAAVTDCELAARFEWGMQRLYSASTDEHKRFHKAWTNGVAYLEQFRSLASAVNGYAVLSDRWLNEDLQVASAMLSGDPTALTNVVVRDSESRDRCPNDQFMRLI